MKQFLWLGLLLLSASWLYFIPQFITPDITIGAVFLILGTLSIIAGLWNMKPRKMDITYALLLVPLMFALLVVPVPYSFGIIVLIIGLLTMVGFNRAQSAYAIPYGIMLSGVILIIQTAVLPLYTKVVSQGHRIDILSPVISIGGSLLGLQASTSKGIVFLNGIQQTYPFTTTWENLGLFLWINIFLGAILFFILLKKRSLLFNSFIFLITSIIYLILRYIAMLHGFLNTTDVSLFWDPALMTISFLPFVILLMKLIPFSAYRKSNIQIPTLVFSKKHLKALFLTFLFIFSVVGACTFHDPGTMKHGRVLIDEYHSQWADTTRPMDTEWYGLLSTYNYYSWAQYLRHYYDVVININSTLMVDLLTAYDILILKCPTESYSNQEIQSIRQFVDQGGGLYLIGDHTNVFGMNTFLNQVSEQFGIRFKNDATYELGTGDLSVYRPDRFSAHPAIQHVNQFDFMTSCTLEPTSFLASVRMEPIIIGNKVISEPGTYATENFFRESVGATDIEYGYLLQAAAITYGQGRVVAFTDSTVFSSFSMFTDGYPSFTLGAMEYLNRTNTYGSLTSILLLFAGLCAAGVFLYLRNTKKIKCVWIILFSGMLAFSVASPLFSYVNTITYPLPHPHTEYIQVCFEQQYSSFDVSVKPTIMISNNKDNYGTFYVWTQRMNCVPSLEKTLSDAVAKADIVVIINPSQPFAEAEKQMISKYLENGGKILLMDSITNNRSTANELASTYGIWIMTQANHHAVSDVGSQNDENRTIGNISAPYLTLSGGTQVLINELNQITATMMRFNNTRAGPDGILVVVVDSFSFSDAVMGGLFTEPTNQQQQIYQTMFYLFEKILLS